MTADEVHFRVSSVMAPGGTFFQRHIFTDLSGEIAQALCPHTAVVSQLKDDDLTLPVCHHCQMIFAMQVATDLGVELFSEDSDWLRDRVPVGPVVVDEWNDELLGDVRQALDGSYGWWRRLWRRLWWTRRRGNKKEKPQPRKTGQ